MSLRPNGLTEIPAETARVARAAFPRDCLVLRVRDALGVLFTDEQFAEWMTGLCCVGRDVVLAVRLRP
jgi:hypothetical protein